MKEKALKQQMNEDYAKYLLKKTKQNYNIIAQHFSKTREKEWTEINFLINDLVNKGEKILDLGCGNGRLFGLLKEKDISYIGVDNSEELINIARKKFPVEPEFQVADALKLPFSNNYFDKVYSIATLHHIPSKKFRLLFLKETKRVLKKEGILIITVWNLWQELKFQKIILKFTLSKLFNKTKLDFKISFILGKILKEKY